MSCVLLLQRCSRVAAGPAGGHLEWHKCGWLQEPSEVSRLGGGSVAVYGVVVLLLWCLVVLLLWCGELVEFKDQRVTWRC
jgi:hypothetical protein